MPNLMTRARKRLLRKERVWDRWKWSVRDRLGFTRPALIAPYRGFGGDGRLWFRGRILEDDGLLSELQPKTLLTNIVYSLRRFESDEIPGALIRWRFGKMEGEVESDAEGFFGIDIHDAPALASGGLAGRIPWDRLELDLVHGGRAEAAEVCAAGPIRFVSDKAKIAIISDIDDTIIKTGAFDFRTHWRNVATFSASERIAMPGTATLYRALARGEDGPQTHPVFYVSSGPWNLYEHLQRFMLLNDIPLGPIFLKDWGLDETKWFTGGHSSHKTEAIEMLMRSYRDLSFVLIGDSGQSDAAIYADIARRHPDRIAAVFIRDVDRRHGAEVEALDTLLQSLSIPYSHTADMAEAAAISEGQGWITRAEREGVDRSIEAIRSDDRYWLTRLGTDSGGRGT